MSAEYRSISIPASVYAELAELARQEDSDPAQTLTRLVHEAHQQRKAAVGVDPMLAMIGKYSSAQELIDGIPVSEDPVLYRIAAGLGEHAAGLHAWEIAPRRYRRAAGGMDQMPEGTRVPTVPA